MSFLGPHEWTITKEIKSINILKLFFTFWFFIYTKIIQNIYYRIIKDILN